MSTIHDQLLKHERDELRRDMKEPAVAGPGILPLIAELWDWQAYRRARGRDDAWIALAIDRRACHFPGWSREQVSAVLGVENIGGAVGERLGVARRLAADDPAELALATCLGTRLTWLQRRIGEQSGIGVDEDDGFLLLRALPVRDDALIERVVDAPALEQDPERGMLYRGLAAAYRRDGEALRGVMGPFLRRRVDRTIRGMRACLAGTAEADPAAVAQGLEEILECEDFLRRRKEGTIVSMEAHALYRLAERFDPALVAGFDTARGLPWDAAFHAWTEAHPRALENSDLTGISPLLHNALVDLKLPGWFRVIEPPELPQDPCRVTLDAIGPNRGQVEEIFAVYARVHGAAVPDLDGGCPLLFPVPLPRAAAFLMRSSLIEAGASARMERVA